MPNYKNPYRGFNVRITEPRGEGTIVAVLSDKPISALDTPDKPKTFATPEAGRAAIKRIHDELARSLQVRAGIRGTPGLVGRNPQVYDPLMRTGARKATRDG